jgi:hypothetical protein
MVCIKRTPKISNFSKKKKQCAFAHLAALLLAFQSTRPLPTLLCHGALLTALRRRERGASGDNNRRGVVAYETPRSIFLSLDVPLRPVRTNSNLGSENR